MKIPLHVGDVTLTYEAFVNQNSNDIIVAVEDRTYRLHALDDGVFYMMVRIGGHQRTLRGTMDALLEAIGKIHVTYRQYETRVRRGKEDAQRARDHALNEAAESLK